MGMLALLLSAHATWAAAPMTLMVTDDSGKTTLVEASLDAPGHYSFATSGYLETIGDITVHQDALPSPIARIEYRYIVSSAIGDEGPWINLEGLEQPGEWKPISGTPRGKTITLRLPEETPDFPSFSANQTQIAAALDRSTYPEKDLERWRSLAKKCASESDDNPCYTYINADELRVTLTNKEQLLFTITRPGGC
jgi:hypothetical protein